MSPLHLTWGGPAAEPRAATPPRPAVGRITEVPGVPGHNLPATSPAIASDVAPTGHASAAPSGDSDWHEAALLHAITWMLLGLPVGYAIVATASLLWAWLFEVVGWIALLGVPAPLGLILAASFGLYVEVPRRAWAIHRSRGGPLCRAIRLVRAPGDQAVTGLAR